jgi:hypothetical protein
MRYLDAADGATAMIRRTIRLSVLVTEYDPAGAAGKWAQRGAYLTVERLAEFMRETLQANSELTDVSIELETESEDVE